MAPELSGASSAMVRWTSLRPRPRSAAAQQGLSNLIFVVNCNLQRLDGPVRGNGKIIQELEGTFSGSGWRVVKVIWGAGWDELLTADTDGALLAKLTATCDGEFQRLATLSGAALRDQFFGDELGGLVAHLSDRELELLPRGGHDSTKIAAAYATALDEGARPTAILAKTVKGWALGPRIEARNATHQVKKMSGDDVVAMAARLHIGDILEAELATSPAAREEMDAGMPPYLRPLPGSPEAAYLAATRQDLGDPLPAREDRSAAWPALTTKVFDELDAGSKGHEVSTTMAFVRGLRGLMRDPSLQNSVVPIVSDEARTFGMESIISESAIYDPEGMHYESVDAAMQLSYRESDVGRILQEGISEAGGLASFIGLGTAYATHAVRMLPVFLYYSQFGFQRVGDAVWQASDMRARGILAGGTAGRTTPFGPFARRVHLMIIIVDQTEQCM